MPPRSEVVAIVGGGASGVLTAAHLLRAAPGSTRVVIIEPRGELGEGIAYSTTDVGHLLNVRAGCLSALPDEPDHFTTWVRQHTTADGQSFLPRAWYGKYLRSLLRSIEHIHARAVQVSPRAAGVEIALSDGTRHTVDRVVLASGASPSVWPEGLGGGVRRWIEDPWFPGILANLHPDEPVLLVGTGLTAVDVTLSLQAAGHRQILATSRHGLLPSAHPQKPFALPLVVPPSWPSARSLLAWARTTADEVGDWRPVVDALRPHTDELWGALAIGERTRLLRHVQRRWEVLRHRMPPSVAERIEAMRVTGQLTIVPGGVWSAHSTSRGVDVTLADRRLRVGAVINCTGSSADVRRSRDPLVQYLLYSRVARPGPLFLGLDTDARGCMRDTNDGIWVVGPLRRGRRWESTAIPEIRTQATDLSRSLGRAGALVGA
jgi:uncharacterized NAD(P)/FAD-binding protein YdhS